MSRNCSGVWTGIVLMVLATAWQPVSAQPVCLVGRDNTFYRFNTNGNGLMEEIPSPVAKIIGMTRVPPGAAVAGCSAGDVLAVEGVDGSRAFRIEGHSCGAPSLVQVGELSHGATSVAFAHGQLCGVANTTGGLVFRRFDAGYQQIGEAITLHPTAKAGGLAFDGVNTWYALGQISPGADRLFKFTDPPAAGGLMEVGHPGIGIGDSGLEYFGGDLWGAFLGPGQRAYVGMFNTQTGHFTAMWDRPQSGFQTFGFVALPERSGTAGDVNCDGSMDGMDVAPFVMALINPAAFADALPDCSLLNADLSGDCMVDGNDVQPFVNALLGS